MLYNEGLSIDPTATDSIVVNLWSPANLTASAYTSSGIIHSDGTAAITFPIGVLNQSYYIVLRNRNSLETWSKDPVLFNNANVSFDFTSK